MATETFEATVRRVNGHGVTVEGRDGWLNISKYADPSDVQTPAVGQRVVLTLDGQGFVRKIAPAIPAPVTANPSAPVATPVSRPGREVVIARLAIINSAIALLASGGRQLDADATLDVADRMERWATR